MPKKLKENTDSGSKKTRGKPQKYGGGITIVRSFSASREVVDRLATASAQIGRSQSEIVVAGVLGILDQSPNLLADEVRRRVG